MAPETAELHDGESRENATREFTLRSTVTEWTVACVVAHMANKRLSFGSIRDKPLWQVDALDDLDPGVP